MSENFVSKTPPTILFGHFLNFTGVLFTVWKCACGLDIIVKLFFSLNIFNMWTKSYFGMSDEMIGYYVSGTPTILFRSDMLVVWT